MSPCCDRYRAASKGLEIDLGNDVEVTAEVEALREVLDWGVYCVGNALECVCQAKERDLGEIRRQLEGSAVLRGPASRAGRPAGGGVMTTKRAPNGSSELVKKAARGFGVDLLEFTEIWRAESDAHDGSSCLEWMDALIEAVAQRIETKWKEGSCLPE
jgi:hypothetical protein